MRDLGAELGVPVIVCLEGGYSVGALAASVAGDDGGAGFRSNRPGEADGAFAEPFRRHHARHWELAP